VQLTVGSFLVVCNVGAGAEVTVLRRGTAGFEVLSTLADPAAGGTAIDDAITAALTAHNGSHDGDSARWVLAASVRAAKHAPADRAAVTMTLPDNSATVLTVGLLDQTARPVLRRVVHLMSEAIAAAEISVHDLTGTTRQAIEAAVAEARRLGSSGN